MKFNDNKAIFLQLADRIMDAIVAQRYLPEQRIPSVREYAAEVEVNPNTVVRTYEFLESKNIVFNRRGLGYFVAADAPAIIMEMRRSIFYSDELPYFFERLNSFGWKPMELAAEYEQYLKKHQKQ